MVTDGAVLRTHQISSEIIELIDRARDYCFLVTPYLHEWPLLTRALEGASRRRLPLSIITRTPDRDRAAWYDSHPFVKLGFELVALDRLHTKLYLNENTAIVSSMNLYDNSRENNFELGLLLKGADASLLKRKVIDSELLAAKPAFRVEGTLVQPLREARQKMLALHAEFASRGFCVSCGTRTELGIRGERPRCLACYTSRPDVDVVRLKITRCHYCGGGHPSTLAAPFHPTCQGILRDFAAWTRSNHLPG